MDEQGYRAATFAKKVGVPQSTLAEILSGKRDFNNVGVSKIIAIAQGFGVTVEYLSGEPDTPKYPSERMKARMADLFTQLNEDGQRKLIDIANDMVSSGNYR